MRVTSQLDCTSNARPASSASLGRRTRRGVVIVLLRGGCIA
jgi:hypothetical protein